MGKSKRFISKNTPSSPLQGTSPARGEANNHTRRNYTPCAKQLAINLRKNATPQERLLWHHLRNQQMGVKFRRQFPIDNKYIADFICLEHRLIIEIDGSQHAGNQQDLTRTRYLTRQNFRVIRFWNIEIVRDIKTCLEVIYRALHFPPGGGSGPQDR